MTCPTCKGERWVCENHRNAPWNEKLDGGCECGAGAPCDECNASDRDLPPAMPPGYVEIDEVKIN